MRSSPPLMPLISKSGPLSRPWAVLWDLSDAENRVIKHFFGVPKKGELYQYKSPIRIVRLNLTSEERYEGIHRMEEALESGWSGVGFDEDDLGRVCQLVKDIQGEFRFGGYYE